MAEVLTYPSFDNRADASISAAIDTRLPAPVAHPVRHSSAAPRDFPRSTSAPTLVLDFHADAGAARLPRRRRCCPTSSPTLVQGGPGGRLPLRNPRYPPNVPLSCWRALARRSRCKRVPISFSGVLGGPTMANDILLNSMHCAAIDRSDVDAQV